MCTVINISKISDKYFVWDALDVGSLREDYRIVGTLVGCLPRKPLQNVHLGLPLQLMKQEVQLLIDKGFARIVDNHVQSEPMKNVTCSNDEAVSQLLEHRKRLYTEQVEACLEDKQRLISQNLNRISLGKRSKLVKTGLASGSEMNEAELEEKVQQQMDDIKIQRLPEKSSSVQIKTAKVRSDMSDSIATFPSSIPFSKLEKVEYRIFKHFWEQGLYLTCGGKFGGKYLVYPGDPSRFHSFYIAVCIDHDQQLSATELIRFGRLGSYVKKTIVLCSVDDNDQVHCVSLQWTKIN